MHDDWLFFLLFVKSICIFLLIVQDLLVSYEKLFDFLLNAAAPHDFLEQLKVNDLLLQVVLVQICL